MDKCDLRKLYISKGMSMSEIARSYGYSIHKVEYWMDKYSLARRSGADAQIMKKHGITGGFKIKQNLNSEEAALYGLGIGLYWGEGNKRNQHTVRLGNTDPGIIATFTKFLVEICGVTKESIRYSLQIFTDIDEKDALNYWIYTLSINKKQIMPTVTKTISGKIGTYKMKNQYGVITLYVFNVKLRNWLVDQLYVPR